MSPLVVHLVMLDELISILSVRLAQNLGLLLGAFGWGLGSDIWGRKWVSVIYVRFVSDNAAGFLSTSPS